MYPAFGWSISRTSWRSVELPTKVMRADTSLHAKQARPHVREPCVDLTSRPLLTPHNCAAAIESDDVERVLPNVDSGYGDGALEFCGGHGVLLVWVPSTSLPLAGWEHGRTIRLPDLRLSGDQRA